MSVDELDAVPELPVGSEFVDQGLMPCWVNLTLMTCLETGTNLWTWS